MGGGIGGLISKGVGMAKGFVKDQGGVGGLLSKGAGMLGGVTGGEVGGSLGSAGSVVGAIGASAERALLKAVVGKTPAQINRMNELTLYNKVRTQVLRDVGAKLPKEGADIRDDADAAVDYIIAVIWEHYDAKMKARMRTADRNQPLLKSIEDGFKPVLPASPRGRAKPVPKRV